MVSIGPRPFGHGNEARGAGLFHGRCTVSIGPRPFGHGNTSISEKSFGLKQRVSIGPRPFGHGNVAVLMWGAMALEDGVSIGPRPFGHGNGNDHIGNAGRSSCFNWATSFRTWKCATKGASANFAARWRFQLGHVLSDMEIQVLQSRTLRNSWSVSIGPRPFGHGNE